MTLLVCFPCHVIIIWSVNITNDHALIPNQSTSMSVCIQIWHGEENINFEVEFNLTNKYLLSNYLPNTVPCTIKP